MQQDLEQTGAIASLDDAPLWTAAARRRLVVALIALLCILLLAVVPPYFSISRYQRRVATAISGALGRPVHFDRISIHLLPIPGLTIGNFVVSESPDFGAEPVLRSNSVEARLRVSSLWRRRLEVSRISLESPSINLVRRRADAQWNLQGILMRASQMNSAPTAQPRAGDAPRFPYIEATDARINIKSDDDKLPFSVKEAEFALWLPEPDEWHLRMVGKPVRTDTDVSDVGLLRVEGTLGRAADLPNAPIDLSASWKPTPLGEAAKLTAGYDMGWRGEASATATLRGTIGAAKLVTEMHLLGLHRADYLPAQTAEINAHCEAATAGLLRSLHDVRCAVPTNDAVTISSVIDALRRLPAPSPAANSPEAPAKPGVLLVRAEVPNVLDWRTASGSASLTDASAEYATTWARLFLQSIPATMHIGGTFELSASTEPAEEGPRRWDALLTCTCVLPEPPVKGEQKASTKNSAKRPNRWTVSLRHDDATGTFDESAEGMSVFASPTPAAAAKAEDELPPEPTAGSFPIAGQVTHAGYFLRYTSRAAVLQAAAVVPSLGEGVPADAAGALAAGGDWYLPPIWTHSQPLERRPVARKRRSHR